MDSYFLVIRFVERNLERLGLSETGMFNLAKLLIRIRMMNETQNYC